MSVLEQRLPSPQLPTTGGVTHLPHPTGRYQVGFTDVMTPRMGADRLPILFRLYYPAVPQDAEDTSRWPPWFPVSQYAQGYIRYKFSRFPCQSLLGWIFQWLSSDPRCPVQERLTPLRGKFPVIVYSHGLAACRTTYSFLCYDLASRGYCVAAVEHGDRSACLRTQVEHEGAEPTYLWQELVEAGQPEYELRNRQVKQRAVEVGMTLDMLYSINQGKMGDTGAWTLDSSGGHGAGEMDWERLSGCLDLEKPVVAGHSFGGATAVLALATDQRFKSGVVLDGWMFPLREEKLTVPRENLLFINCENFQGKNNLKVMKRFELTESSEDSGDLSPGSNVLTILGASHHACTDVNVILQGSYAGWVMNYLLPGTSGDMTKLDAYTSTLLNVDLFAGWLDRCLRGNTTAFAQSVKSNWEFLSAGIRME